MKNLRAVCSSITGEVRKNNEDNYCFFSRFRPLEQEDTGFLVYSSESGEIRQLEYPETAEEKDNGWGFLTVSVVCRMGKSLL